MEASTPSAHGAHDVFISYGGPDKAVAQRFRQALVDAGLRPWVAFADIPLGAKYSEQIVSAVQRCRAVVVLVSAGSMESEHVFREIAEAASLSKPLLPIYLEPDVVLPKGVLYYLAPLHRIKVSPDRIERGAALVAAALHDPQAWQRGATPPPLLERLRVSPFRSAGQGLGVTVLGGLLVWGLQALWQQHADGQAMARDDALPGALASVQVLSAERPVSIGSVDGPWQLQLTVTLGADDMPFRDAKLLLRSRGVGVGGADEVFDLTAWINARRVGGGQALAGPLPHLGRDVVACLTLPHPRTGEAWRLTAAFAGARATAADGIERITYMPSAAPRAARENGATCD